LCSLKNCRNETKYAMYFVHERVHPNYCCEVKATAHVKDTGQSRTSLVENGATGPVRLGLQSRFSNWDQQGGTKGSPL
jgi:hypothetical protein